MNTPLKTLLLLITLPVALSAQDLQDGWAAEMPMKPTVAAPPAPELGPVVPHQDAELRFYEVGDITGLDAVGRRQAQLRDNQLGHDDVSLRGQLAELEADRQQAISAADDLATMITAYVNPSFAEFAGQVKAMGGTSLVVHCTPEQQVWVKAFLKKQREDRAIITVAAQVITVDFGALPKRFYDPKNHVTVLDAEQHTALLAELERTESEVVMAPAISTWPRQRGSLRVVDEQSFIVDWELRVVQPGDRKLAVPIIDTVGQGVVVDLQAVPLPEGTYGLALRIEHSDIEEPVETLELVLDEDLDPVEMSLLTVRIFRIDTTLVMAPGTHVLFVNSSRMNGSDVAVLVELTEAPALSGG